MDDKNLVNGRGVPMGLGMALAQDLNAMNYFASLGESGQRQIIEQTHGIRSKEEMRQFVSNIGKSDSFS